MRTRRFLPRLIATAALGFAFAAFGWVALTNRWNERNSDHLFDSVLKRGKTYWGISSKEDLGACVALITTDLTLKPNASLKFNSKLKLAVGERAFLTDISTEAHFSETKELTHFRGTMNAGFHRLTFESASDNKMISLSLTSGGGQQRLSVPFPALFSLVETAPGFYGLKIVGGLEPELRSRLDEFVGLTPMSNVHFSELTGRELRVCEKNVNNLEAVPRDKALDITRYLPFISRDKSSDKQDHLWQGLLQGMVGTEQTNPDRLNLELANRVG